MLNSQPFIENKDVGAFARPIVDTVTSSDRDLRVPAARRLLGIEYLTEQRGNAASLVAGYSIASEITRRSDKRTGAGEHSGEAEARLEYFVGNRALRCLPRCLRPKSTLTHSPVRFWPVQGACYVGCAHRELFNTH
jgi:hypothetical protein